MVKTKMGKTKIIGSLPRNIKDSNGKEWKLENNNAMPVNVQDQTSEVIDLFLHRTLGTFTLLSNTVVDTNNFTANPGHGFVINDTICFVEGLNFSQFTVIDVVGDLITIDSPMDRVYTTVTTYQRHTPNMSVDGSIIPQVYFIKPAPGVKYDITRINLVIENNSTMDFSNFGGITKLTKGCVLRKKDGIFKNYFNWKTNGDFVTRSFDFVIQAKTGGGVWAFTGRSTFGGQSKRGVVIRLDGDLNDELQVIIQDDLTSLNVMTIIAQGHVVID